VPGRGAVYVQAIAHAGPVGSLEEWSRALNAIDNETQPGEAYTVLVASPQATDRFYVSSSSPIER